MNERIKVVYQVTYETYISVPVHLEGDDYNEALCEAVSDIDIPVNGSSRYVEGSITLLNTEGAI